MTRDFDDPQRIVRVRTDMLRHIRQALLRDLDESIDMVGVVGVVEHLDLDIPPTTKVV